MSRKWIWVYDNGYEYYYTNLTILELNKLFNCADTFTPSLYKFNLFKKPNTIIPFWILNE